MSRNPSWSTDELILALDVYFRNGQLGPTSPEVIELSEILRSLHIDIEVDRSDSFRNENGVGMKLGNFAHFDPVYEGVGLRGGGKRDRELFEYYTDRRDECHQYADAIRRGMAEGNLPDVSVTDEDSSNEGRLLRKMHSVRERSPKLAAKRRSNMRKQLGQLSCEVCDLDEVDVAARFGAVKGEFFECHHKLPLHTLTSSRKTRVSDLAVVCPNCHKALHRVRTMPTVEALRSRMRA